MNKQDKSDVMNSIGRLNLPDEQALTFIEEFADSQLFKSPRAYESFCTDCAIFYTSSMFVLSHKMKNLSNDELYQWRDDFIDKCKYFNMVSREGEGK